MLARAPHALATPGGPGGALVQERVICCVLENGGRAVPRGRAFFHLLDRVPLLQRCCAASSYAGPWPEHVASRGAHVERDLRRAPAARSARGGFGVKRVAMSDITRERAALVARILQGDGEASREQRRAAFLDEGVEATVRDLVRKIARRPGEISGADIAVGPGPHVEDPGVRGLRSACRRRRGGCAAMEIRRSRRSTRPARREGLTECASRSSTRGWLATIQHLPFIRTVSRQPTPEVLKLIGAPFLTSSETAWRTSSTAMRGLVALLGRGSGAYGGVHLEAERVRVPRQGALGGKSARAYGDEAKVAARAGDLDGAVIDEPLRATLLHAPHVDARAMSSRCGCDARALCGRRCIGADPGRGGRRRSRSTRRTGWRTRRLHGARARGLRAGAVSAGARISREASATRPTARRQRHLALRRDRHGYLHRSSPRFIDQPAAALQETRQQLYLPGSVPGLKLTERTDRYGGRV